MATDAPPWERRCSVVLRAERAPTKTPHAQGPARRPAAAGLEGRPSLVMTVPGHLPPCDGPVPGLRNPPGSGSEAGRRTGGEFIAPGSSEANRCAKPGQYPGLPVGWDLARVFIVRASGRFAIDR